MSSTWDKLRWSIHHRGVAKTVEAAAKGIGRRLQPQPELPPHPFDPEHGTDTGGLIAGGELAAGHPSDRFIEGYAAVPPSRFRSILARLQLSEPPHPLGEYTFVDLGCGKGRALLLASELHFREVVGVELNPSLAAIARSNVTRWIGAGNAGCPIRVEQGDAIEFTWPENPVVLFLFNPFGAELMNRLADKLVALFGDRPDDLEVLYYKPEQAVAFVRHFKMIWCEAIGLAPEELAVDPVADPRDEICAYRLLRR